MRWTPAVWCMIYFFLMTGFTRRFFILGIAVLLAMLIAALAHTVAIQSSQQNNLAGAALVLQSTVTPESEELSEIGSTDGIVAMGGVIALIILIPVLARYKYWARPSSQ